MTCATRIRDQFEFTRAGHTHNPTNHDDVFALDLGVDQLDNLGFASKLPKEGDLVDEARPGFRVVASVDPLEREEVVALGRHSVHLRRTAATEDPESVIHPPVDL
jgi:hypothetical protein